MEGIEQVAVFAPGIEGLDQRITLWMNALHTDWMDPFWIFMSGIQVWIPMYVIVAAMLIWRLGWKKGLISIAAIAIAFALNEQVNNFIKAMVMRVRPCNDPNMLAMGIHVLETGGGWSFPSGHANNSWGFAIGSFLCLGIDSSIDRSSSAFSRENRLYTCYGIFICTWATLVAISRIMVARHFLGDVIVGGLIGSLMGWVWATLAIYICKKIK